MSWSTAAHEPYPRNASVKRTRAPRSVAAVAAEAAEEGMRRSTTTTPSIDTEADAEPTTDDPALAGGMRSQIMEGLRYILGHEYLGNIAATTATSNLFGNIGFAIFPVYRIASSRCRRPGSAPLGGSAEPESSSAP
jgi:hypothetical protein